MEGGEVLGAIAQVALGLTGFAGVVISFWREPAGFTRVQGYRIGLLFLQPGGALLLSLIPFALFYLNLPLDDVWGISSGIMATLNTGFLGWYLLRSREIWLIAPEIFRLPVFFSICISHFANISLQTANALHGFGPPYLGLYLFGLIWLLLVSLFQFGRIVFFPQRNKRRRKR
ncbi:MAG: hypothetical protein WEC37_01810 [Anaerolineales bacterium]